MRNFRNYDFWIDAKKIAIDVYRTFNGFPNEERYALCDQLRRSVTSIASNIAEGAGRTSETDFSRFLDYALGSACEVETQLEIAKDLGYVDQETAQELIERLQSIERRLTAFMKPLKQQN